MQSGCQQSWHVSWLMQSLWSSTRRRHLRQQFVDVRFSVRNPLLPLRKDDPMNVRWFAPAWWVHGRWFTKWIANSHSCRMLHAQFFCAFFFWKGPPLSSIWHPKWSRFSCVFASSPHPFHPSPCQYPENSTRMYYQCLAYSISTTAFI